MLRTMLLIGTFIVAAAPALADEQSVIRQAQAPAHNPIDCYCRAQGRMVPQGETACLPAPDGWRLAECRMVLNVMSWGFTETPCPQT